PNTVFAGYTKQALGQEIDFLTWMRVGIPLVAVYLPLAWAVLVFVVFPVTLREIPGGKELIQRERAALGPPSRSEWIVLVAFSCAVMLWVTRAWLAKLPPLTNLTDGGIAMAAAFVLFLIPRGKVGPAANDPHIPGGMVLDWATASRIPWGVLLLFGGGLSLGAAMTSTKLDAHIGQLFTGLGGLHPALVVTILVVSVVALSELASNTAVATALLPVLGAAAVGMGVHPYLLLIPATLAASCGFMLPVATPPNTVVFASGHVSVRDMVKGGLALDLIGIVLVILFTLFLAGPLLGEDLSRVPAWATPPKP
ncbi:MAG: SLC13 family permease, partial [Vicinamibacteria bacterium]|nr:SLC13 family permease [Vicinamibacteria bacterium]